MLGLSRSTKESQKPFFEYLRIESTEDGIVYFASPLGKNETRFPMTELSEREVVFENPEHDFPQRIIYQLEGTELRARLEGVVNGQPRSEQWRRRRVST